MKILSVDQIRKADAYTIRNEPISDLDLMERAASRIFQWFIKHIPNNKKIRIFCGMGNNGGDGLVLARLLSKKSYCVEVMMVKYADKMSPSCETNFHRLCEIKEIEYHMLTSENIAFEIHNDEIVVDAIFGSGLSKPVKGFIGEIIDRINVSAAYIIAIDAPSGLYTDQSNQIHDGKIIKADRTLSLQFPKLGYLFPENDMYVGNVEIIPIGLHPEFIQKVEARHFYLKKQDITAILKKRNKFSHKGTFGHGLLIAGGYGKMGAAILSARAASRCGAGLITAHLPFSGNQIMQISSPETMTSIDTNEKYFSIAPDLGPFNAIAVGPGIGKEKQTQQALKLLIQNTGTSLIFDADAINILAENKTWLSFLPKECIFTPHPKEFERLIGKAENNFERLKMQIAFSIKYHAFVILKGAYSCITTPHGNTYFNSTGNAGMATGGSGDVLTGMILGLKARGYSAFHASILGVYLHGKAGDLAAKKKGQDAMIASDIIDKLPKAFKGVYSE